MKLILSHPTANNFAKAIAYKFAQEDMLYEFYTAMASFPGDFWDKLQKINSLSEIQRRSFTAELKPYTRTCPWLEIGRMLCLKTGFDKLIQHESGLFSVDAVYRSIDNQAALGLKNAFSHGVTAVYAYEDGALATFTKAKALGIKCIYDLPIAYWETGRVLMQEEARRLPAWAKTLGGGIHDSERKLKKKIQELELADMVVVPSQFVMDSLPDWARQKKIIIVPFGTPDKDNEKINSEDTVPNLTKPLRVMFAGSMSQRKGLGDLFSALKFLNNSNIELVVMGGLQAPINFYRDEFPNFTYEAGRPNSKVLELMRSCDVFCLPSIVEGRALVIQEAMSQGLPIIITPNTGGEDLVIDGVTGFLVPIRSPENIAEKIQWFLDHRSKIAEMGKMAKLHAQQFTWKNYGNKIVESINEFLG